MIGLFSFFFFDIGGVFFLRQHGLVLHFCQLLLNSFVYFLDVEIIEFDFIWFVLEHHCKETGFEQQGHTSHGQALLCYFKAVFFCQSRWVEVDQEIQRAGVVETEPFMFLLQLGKHGVVRGRAIGWEELVVNLARQLLAVPRDAGRVVLPDYHELRVVLVEGHAFDSLKVYRESLLDLLLGGDVQRSQGVLDVYFSSLLLGCHFILVMIELFKNLEVVEEAATSLLLRDFLLDGKLLGDEVLVKQLKVVVGLVGLKLLTCSLCLRLSQHHMLLTLEHNFL